MEMGISHTCTLPVRLIARLELMTTLEQTVDFSDSGILLAASVLTCSQLTVSQPTTYRISNQLANTWAPVFFTAILDRLYIS